MANTKEIQKRMKSIRDTMKITSAMYMISSAKLRSAKQKLEQTEPYFYALQGSISRFLRHIPEVQNRYFDQKKEIPEEEKRRGYIVITADKGLAGAYNHNVIKMAQSYRAYERVQQKTGCDLDYKTYQGIFDVLQGEAGDMVTIYLQYPIDTGTFSIADEDGAIAFTQEIIDAALQVGSELTGGEICFTVLDAPYPNSETRKAENYFISEDDFKGGVKKGIAAGALLGIIAEVALYTFWLILYRKPKSAEEVRACLDIPVIDDVKTRKANEEEVYKKLALFLKEKQRGADHKGVSVNCMPVGYFKKDAGLKLAMSFANEKKKTLLIDLVKEPEGKEAGNSISRYVLGDESRPVPTTQNSYLDVLCRDVAEEKNFDVVMNERFASYVKEMQDTYEYIVINSPNVAESADAFAAGKLCDKNFVVCARGGVNNETLYRLKNEAAVQGIVLEGVLVYEL